MEPERAPPYDLVAQVYDLGRVVDGAGQPARGLQGHVWRLCTSSGVWAVKESFAEIHQEEARRWGEFQEIARRAGVTAPQVRTSRDGSQLTRLAGKTIRVQSWVDLDEPSIRLDPTDLGTTLANLHRVGVPAEGQPHRWYTEPVGAATWDELVDASQAADAPFADRLAQLRDDLVALELTMTPMAPVQTCHLDLWSDNVRGTPDGRICIIDWDNCGPADPARELALVVFEFARSEPRRAVELCTSYRSNGGPGELREPGDFAMVAAQLGHIGERHLRRWLDPATSDRDRKRALTGIEEFLGDPLTPAVITGILDTLKS